MKLLRRGAVPDVLVIEPEISGDARGFFMETWNARGFAELGIEARFVQDNHSRSRRNVVRGLHYQIRRTQGKLVRVAAGEIFDVAVDLRRSSPTFRRWAAERLSAENRRMLWIPPGFAHGYLALSDWADVQYKTTDYYAPEHERILLWNDPALAIAWPLAGEPVMTKKDQDGVPLAQAETFD